MASAQSGHAQKRQHGSTQGGKWKPKKTKREKNIAEGSSEDILRLDIQALLKSRPTIEDPEPLPEQGTQVDIEILELSSTGDALGMIAGSNQVYVTEFAVPGDTARVKVYRHLQEESRTIADFISITKPSPLRDDTRIQCKYFGKCGGCQFQMLDYPEQLKLKKRVLEKAYANFSNLPAELVPTMGDTIGSPLQYNYRTKLTPHFDGPPGMFRGRGKKSKAHFDSCPDIGFMLKGTRRVMDIEECPIGTEAVNLGMNRERARMKEEYKNYTKGATILLRENTQRLPKGSADIPETLPPYTTKADNETTVDIKSCITDPKGTSTEHIDSYVFTNPANSFFQNNNSILPKFTAFIREHILPPAHQGEIKYLIDAYSGSGLFTITLSSVFQHSTGIDIAADSIACARKNAELNGLNDERCSFIAADAGELFKSVTYNNDETVVVLDPPRKGCDADFLGQLRRFGPKRVLYVSCNVHTQARDVGVLVRGEGDGWRYEIESLRGFDFFPQTGHVEGVAILNRVEQ
ncbi:putative tRNA (Uracil-5-)-methyltransferase [Emericellopsis cladophorae]|uniref:tRNA (uracil(54)-C(5))-methyltransferase n=1 Tax=Emericellopsis cladophorae TaxID=2686198 RepID=A0A9Q0BED5_9HYPO|nr:putative tRNA (Uracil-5-)-methyltransferase [Emericellopsis cladophorae]KAI6781746.1 putative tRNA (Uracil-5-)-methyltransferase [Emericellopsis cladophorae]